ncbi:MAG: hypothetical protein ACP5KN_01035 [Armatimonadota bacterium]
MGGEDGAERRYGGAAVLTWFLYYVGFGLIGLIVNIIYLSEARRHAQTSGTAPAGTGCLWALLVVHIALPLIGIVVVLICLGEQAFVLG